MAFNSAFLLFLIQQLDPPQKEQLQAALADMDLQLRKLADIPWLWQLVEPCDEEVREDQGYFSLAVLFFPSWLCVFDFLLLCD